jgi:hypothetical protein
MAAKPKTWPPDMSSNSPASGVSLRLAFFMSSFPGALGQRRGFIGRKNEADLGQARKGEAAWRRKLTI